MDVWFMLARLLHVGLGVFWAGTIVFNAAFLMPSMREAGPGGASVSAGLMKRRFLDVVPAAAILTVLSGLYLYWRVSGGFAAAYMGSAMGITYGIGAVLAIVGLALGLGILRPSMLRAAALTQAAAAAPPEERDRALSEAQQLRKRAGGVGIVVAWLLTIAVLAMAVARYL